MSLKINTNISALTALRQLGNTEAKFQGTVNRLSTGLRITSGADDPAGLIISEGMRAQIQGLEQAMRNSQDAINMAKTAESALNEVARLLVNVRSLAVHSANTAVVDSNQLNANQTAFRNALASIDRIAQNTSWGDKKLLNGSAGTTVGITRNDLVQSLYLNSEVGGEVVRGGEISMTQVTAATQTTTGPLANTFASANTAVTPGTFVLNGITITADAGDTVSTIVDKINQHAGQTGVSASISGSGPVSVSLTSVKHGSRFPINYIESTSILNAGASVSPAVGSDAVYTVTVPVEPSGTSSEVFTGGSHPGEDGLTLTSQSGGKLVLTAAGNGTAVTTSVGALTAGTMRFQIGANADQSTTFSMPAIFAERLGTSAIPGENLSTIDLSTQQGAEDAMRIVDAAIKELSTLRGELGSFQSNFLESTMRSLAVAGENLTASESTIRDADMAKEMTEFTKIQILRQSGMAVLAQANQSSQSVLQLLQS